MNYFCVIRRQKLFIIVVLGHLSRHWSLERVVLHITLTCLNCWYNHLDRLQFALPTHKKRSTSRNVVYQRLAVRFLPGPSWMTSRLRRLRTCRADLEDLRPLLDAEGLNLIKALKEAALEAAVQAGSRATMENSSGSMDLSWFHQASCRAGRSTQRLIWVHPTSFKPHRFTHFLSFVFSTAV